MNDKLIYYGPGIKPQANRRGLVEETANYSRDELERFCAREWKRDLDKLVVGDLIRVILDCDAVGIYGSQELTGIFLGAREVTHNERNVLLADVFTNDDCHINVGYIEVSRIELVSRHVHDLEDEPFPGSYEECQRKFRDEIVPEARIKGKHCEATEPCADDVYCNCDCDACMAQPCLRPGCYCKKAYHPDRYRGIIRLV